MSTDYKPTDTCDSSIINIDLTKGQIKLLYSLIDAELNAVECGDSQHDKKTLQSLIDAFFDQLYKHKSENERAKEQQQFLADVVEMEKEFFNTPPSNLNAPGTESFHFEVEVQNA
ncbi:MAG: hypothetical protein PHD12_02750 [Methylotenera sp.]|nr:hypothetical protein [Methylotenera sp.]